MTNIDWENYRWLFIRRFRRQSNNPFRDNRAGVSEDDVVNRKRYYKGLEIYINQFKQKIGYSDKWFQGYQPILFPAVVTPFVWLSFRRYTKPSSIFIRFSAVAFTLVFCWWLGERRVSKDNDLFLMRHFHLFEEDVQYALRGYDARYLRKYWRQDAKLRQDEKDHANLNRRTTNSPLLGET